jgi:Uma2 family endonuclease
MPVLAEKQRLFTVEEYHAMGRAGVLTRDDRVELIDGLIISMSPIGDAHVDCVNRLTRSFILRTDPKAIVSVQNPIRLNDFSEPEPDVVLIRPGKAGVPTARDVLLLVEVADTTLAFDRDVKLPRYAAAGVPEVWIVALEDDHVAVYRHPGPTGYAETRRAERGEEIAIAALPEAGTFAVDAMLRPF